MSFDWRNYFYLATDLITTTSKESSIEEEAYYRAAVSRYYYSVYNLAYNFIQQHSVYQKQYLNDIKSRAKGGNGKGKHQAVREILMHSSNVHEKNIGAQLQTLHEYRKDADYDDTLMVNLFAAEVAYNTAEIIFQELKIIGAA